MGDHWKEVFDEEHRDSIVSEDKALPFQLKRGLSIDDHMNNYMKLLVDILNVDVAIEKEDKALILLNSLSDEEYETFVLTLINGEQTLNYGDVSAALVNHGVRRKDKQSSSKSTSAEALIVKGRSFSEKGKTIVVDRSSNRVSEI